MEEATPAYKDILEFSSIDDLFSHIDEEIKRKKTMLGNIIREIERLKTISEATSKLEQILRELGGQAGAVKPSPSVNLNGVEVFVNPDPVSELKLLTEAARGLQSSISSLERARKSIAPLLKLKDVDLDIKVVFEGGNIKSIIIKFPTLL
ncbi:MAG: hypothetical protein F7B20_06450 [Aeropyrum sp.]|nr:hypothetical protein [Aeropyrum sp.]MCE4616319.1 hypothetical protein [Aeropyrum sp.]